MSTRRIRQTCFVLLLLLLLAVAGCTNKTASVSTNATAPASNSPNPNGDKTATSAATTTAGGNVSACTALTSAEIEAVQGEAFKETKGNDHTSGGLSVSHCVYLLPTYNKSLSLDITRNDKSNATGNAVEQFWETRFRDAGEGAERESEREREKEREREREREKEKSTGREQGRARESEREREEEEAAVKPRPVSGVGDEAFWVGTRIKGTLYVRQKDVVLILSLGGTDDDNAKIKKTTALAQKALKRL